MVGGAEFGLLSFDEQLGPSRLQLSLSKQTEADGDPEYELECLGCYQHLFRETDSVGPVAPTEHPRLDVCIATFTEPVARCARLVLGSSPRYHPAAKKLLNEPIASSGTAGQDRSRPVKIGSLLAACSWVSSPLL